jgi:hypothetical protein
VLSYYAFDLLYLVGRDVHPLLRRKELLAPRPKTRNPREVQGPGPA